MAEKAPKIPKKRAPRAPYASPAERTRVRKSESAARRGRAGVSDVKRLRDNMRRLERRTGIPSGDRALTDAQIKKLSAAERQKVAQEYQRRLRYAEGLAKQGKKYQGHKAPGGHTGGAAGFPSPPAPAPAPQAAPPMPMYGPGDKFQAWDDFLRWLLDNYGITLDSGSELYWKAYEASKNMAADGSMSAAAQFAALCEWYTSQSDVLDI